MQSKSRIWWLRREMEFDKERIDYSGSIPVTSILNLCVAKSGGLE